MLPAAADWLSPSKISIFVAGPDPDPEPPPPVVGLVGSHDATRRAPIKRPVSWRRMRAPKDQIGWGNLPEVAASHPGTPSIWGLGPRNSIPRPDLGVRTPSSERF